MSAKDHASPVGRRSHVGLWAFLIHQLLFQNLLILLSRVAYRGWGRECLKRPLTEIFGMVVSHITRYSDVIFAQFCGAPQWHNVVVLRGTAVGIRGMSREGKPQTVVYCQVLRNTFYICFSGGTWLGNSYTALKKDQKQSKNHKHFWEGILYRFGDGLFWQKRVSGSSGLLVRQVWIESKNRAIMPLASRLISMAASEFWCSLILLSSQIEGHWLVRQPYNLLSGFRLELFKIDKRDLKSQSSSCISRLASYWPTAVCPL